MLRRTWQWLFGRRPCTMCEHLTLKNESLQRALDSRSRELKNETKMRRIGNAFYRTQLYGDPRPPGHRPIKGFMPSGRPIFAEDP